MKIVHSDNGRNYTLFSVINLANSSCSLARLSSSIWMDFCITLAISQILSARSCNSCKKSIVKIIRKTSYIMLLELKYNTYTIQIFCNTISFCLHSYVLTRSVFISTYVEKFGNKSFVLFLHLCKKYYVLSTQNF